jgi:DNA-binding NarL/FixJ family response regulator
MSSIIRVMLADKNPLVRAGVRSTIADETGLSLVEEATTNHETQKLCRLVKPDVLIFGVNIASSSSNLLELVAQTRKDCCQAKLLMISMPDENINDILPPLIDVGISGCMLQAEETGKLIQAIRTVAQGHTWFSRHILKELVRPEIENSSQGKELNLTKREHEILNFLALGLDNTNIANQCFLAKKTVRNYISHIYSKLGFSSRAEAIVWAKDHGLGEKP